MILNTDFKQYVYTWNGLECHWKSPFMTLGKLGIIIIIIIIIINMPKNWNFRMMFGESLSYWTSIKRVKYFVAQMERTIHMVTFTMLCYRSLCVEVEAMFIVISRAEI